MPDPSGTSPTKLPRHAVITGASSGIGKAIAIEMARHGAHRILIHYCSNQAGAEQTAAEVESFGSQAVLCQADLSISDDRDFLVHDAFSKLETIDAWVNNAGVDVLTGDTASLEFEEKLERLVAVDLLGTISLSRLVVDYWLRQTDCQSAPAIIFIGWDQATEGMEGEAGEMFGPVKAAVMAYAKNLAQSVAPRIRVNAVAPGWIRTAWGSEVDGYWDRRAKHQSLMRRWGTPEDVARAVVFLSSAESSFVTGQVLEVNGGWNRRYERDEDSSS